VLEGWPEDRIDSETNGELTSYFRKRLELGVEGGCVMRGCRVVIPKKGRERAIQMLHEAHPGIARMKSLARSYMWWPGMDRAIEECVKKCTPCQSSRKDPPVVPMHPWAWPEKPWTRIHIDYAGPMEGKMFLLIMDAHSKWMEVHVTNTSTSSATIELLRKTFATLGLPEVLVSDNATAFTSTEFTEFLQKNGIRHVRTPPYHLASNGLVDRAVQTFKAAMKRMKEGSLNTWLTRFLFNYRVTPHTSTEVSPAELMFGRKLRSQFDLLRPSVGRKVQQAQDSQKKGHDVRASPRSFSVGESVYAKNYGQGPKWLPGLVVGTEGSALFRVKHPDGRIVRRHLDQLRQCVDSTAAEMEPELDDGHHVPARDTSSGSPEESTAQADSTESPHGTQSPGTAPAATEDLDAEEPGTNNSGIVLDAATQERSSASGDSQHQPLRRSARAKQPPVRFEEQFT